jgi:hypothetical protein
MKANNKEGQTQFYLQKIVVNNYALSISNMAANSSPQDNNLDCAIESHHDRPQPSKAHFDMTQPKLNQNPSHVSLIM